MLARFALYGLAGWVAEILFTGASAAVKRDRNCTGTTYLWMHPIYGGTGLLLEHLSERADHLPRGVRPLAYLPFMYAAEYASGWLLRRVIGRCPWDYGVGRWRVHGLVRVDYAAAWYLLGLAFEPLRDVVRELTVRGESASASAAMLPARSPSTARQ